MSDDRTWWPEGYGDEPAFQVRRQVYSTVTGGDYAHGSGVLTLPKTALRFPTSAPEVADAVTRAILHVRVKNHYVRQEAVLNASGAVTRYIQWPEGDIEITWGWPAAIEEQWTEVALVRSAFGRPSTVNDGQTVFRASHLAFEKLDSAGHPVYAEGATHPTMVTPPVVVDAGLPTGRWYHYGLFFKISEVEWIQGMLDSTLLPRDFHHSDHLWNSVPPYYRWTDDNSGVGRGSLRRFMEVFGFELDTCREYVEAWQHVYDVDWSPIRLLRKLGPNFGYDYTPGIGDIRYRSLFSQLGHFYEIRGTQACLEGVVSHTSKYGCDVTAGGNSMLLPDDSDFYTGTGNWGAVTPFIDAPGSGYLWINRLTLTSNPLTVQQPPTGMGRRSIRVTSFKADATTDIALSCGASDNHDGYISPKEGGIPVKLGMGYGFSVWINSAVIPTTVQLSLLWFDRDENYLGASSGTTAPVNTAATWQEFTIGTLSVPPAGTVYVTPYILFDTRTDSGAYTASSPPIDIAGAMVYAQEAIGAAAGPPSDRYLTVSDPGEPLGGPLKFKGTLTGTATALPAGAATGDAYVLTPAPIPTAAPQFKGVTPNRNAALNDTLYWNGSAWVNAGPLPDTWLPFLLGSPAE